MPQYLVAIHHPDDYDPSVEDEAMGRDIDVLNEEMIAAGIRVFVGGLHPVKSAKSLRAQPDGKVLITDGPYLETKEHIGGFWVLEATDMNEALEWGARPPSPVVHRSRCGSFTHFDTTECHGDSADRGDCSSHRKKFPFHVDSLQCRSTILLLQQNTNRGEWTCASSAFARINPTSRLPTEAEMASMHKFIVEGMKAGWLIECEGVTFGTTGVRVHKAASGEVTVTDGPFAETKEVLGGYALLNAASKEEAVEHTRRFLDHVGQGTCEGTWEGTWETYQLFEMPTGEGQ